MKLDFKENEDTEAEEDFDKDEDEIDDDAFDFHEEWAKINFIFLFFIFKAMLYQRTLIFYLCVFDTKETLGFWCAQKCKYN